MLTLMFALMTSAPVLQEPEAPARNERQDRQQRRIEELRASIKEADRILRDLKAAGRLESDQAADVQRKRDEALTELKRLEPGEPNQRPDGPKEPREPRRVVPPPVEPGNLKRQAAELEARLAELGKQLEGLDGEKRAAMEKAIADLKASLRVILDQVSRMDPSFAPPQQDFRSRERELVEQIGKLQRWIQSGDFRKEEGEKLVAEQRRLEAELDELRAHSRDMKGMHTPRLPDAPLADEQRRRMLGELGPWLKENDPNGAENLNRLWTEKRFDEHERMLRDSYSRMQAMRDMKERDPKEFERQQKAGRLDAESRRLGDELRRVPPEEKEKRAELKKKLGATLTELFDLRETARWRELEALEAQMKEMRQTLESRKVNREKIVEKKAKELAGEKNEDDW